MNVLEKDYSLKIEKTRFDDNEDYMVEVDDMDEYLIKEIHV